MSHLDWKMKQKKKQKSHCEVIEENPQRKLGYEVRLVQASLDYLLLLLQLLQLELRPSLPSCSSCQATEANDWLLASALPFE
jgi:hypothetical protein